MNKDFAPVDPYALARREAAPVQVKRFYREASVGERDGAFQVLLDGKPAFTPARTPLALPSRAAAEAVAAEWNRQGDFIRPTEMAVTRLVNTVLDGVSRTMDEVRAEIIKFAGSDLLCYRADAPPDLVAEQAREWDPMVDWVRDDLGARLFLAEGLVFVQQPEPALAAIAQALDATVGVDRGAPFRLGALHVMTTLSGSALLALAIGRGMLDAAEGWRKAHLDEDFQIAHWGQDDEAAVRRAVRWTDMAAAASVFAAVC